MVQKYLIAFLGASFFLFGCASRMPVSEVQKQEIPARVELMSQAGNKELFPEERAIIRLIPVQIENDYEVTNAYFQDDTAGYANFLKFVKNNMALAGVYHQNFDERAIIRIINEYQFPQPNVPFQIVNQHGKSLWRGVTFANGESVVYPNLMFLKTPGDQLFVEVEHGGKKLRMPLPENGEEIITIAIPQEAETACLDMLLILDGDGQMRSEIEQLQKTAGDIYSRLCKDFPAISFRIGLIAYHEREDHCKITRFDFMNDISEIQVNLNSIDYFSNSGNPKNIQLALQAAVRKMSWRPNAIKLSLLLTDALPYVDFEQTYTYLDAAMEANRRGIKIFTIGAPELNIVSEYMLRQIAALTYSRFIPLNDFEIAESVAGEVNHSIDDLIFDIVSREIGYQTPVLNIARKASLR